MNDPVVENLIRDLIQWLAARDRCYEDVMEAWRTSCPRLPVWEEANDRGFVTGAEVEGRRVVRPTPAGLAFISRVREARKTLL